MQYAIHRSKQEFSVYFRMEACASVVIHMVYSFLRAIAGYDAQVQIRSFVVEC